MLRLYIVTLLAQLICKVHQRNARLDEAQEGIKISGRNNKLRYEDDVTFMAESKEELKSILKVKEDSQKPDLKLKTWLKTQKSKIMASNPIISFQVDGETMETLFILLGSKIKADGECRHEIKRHSLLGRKVMTNLESVLKSRDITCRQRSI